MRKHTHGEYVSRLVADGRGFTALEDYINKRTPILHRCREGHEWRAGPDHILRGTGCPHCFGRYPPSYAGRLTADGRGFVALEDYAGGHTPILHRCPAGHEWRAQPNNILHGRGCPHCAGFRPPHYAGRLAADGRGFIALEDYINNSTPILHRCREGHEWRAVPNHIINTGTGCPDCAEYGFSQSKPAWFYTFELRSGLIKIGITNLDNPRDRYRAKDLPRMRLCKFATRRFTRGADALAVETEAKRRLVDYNYTGESPFSCKTGTSEVFQAGALIPLMNLMRGMRDMTDGERR